MKPPVYLRESRSFGDVITATFDFVAQNFKPLLKAYIKIVLPFLLFFLLACGLLVYFAISSADGGMPNLALIVPAYLLLIVLSLGITPLGVSMISNYIKLYDLNGKENITHEELRAATFASFFPLLGHYFVYGFLTTLGMMLCLIPGIYVMVPLTYMQFIRVYEDRPFGETFSRSFQLMKGNYWNGLGIIVLLSIIGSIVAQAFFLPPYLLGIFGILSGEPNPVLLGIAGLFVLIYFLLVFLIVLLPYIGIGIHYFSLVEAADAPDLNERIEKMYS